MSSPRGFRYGLQPVLLTRRWLYERLQRDLGDVNRVLRQHEEVLRRVQRECDAACAEWVALTHAEYRPDEFLRHHGFIARLREEEGRCHDLLRDTRQRRDAIIDELVGVRRALEGIERHRMQMQSEFLRELMNQEYKQVDDNWNARKVQRGMP